jgi:hypothetical protein
MVFLAAAIPVPGASFLDQLKPEPTAVFNPDWIGQNPFEDDDAALTFLFPGGHCPHISRPRELAALLTSLA